MKNMSQKISNQIGSKNYIFPKIYAVGFRRMSISIHALRLKSLLPLAFVCYKTTLNTGGVGEA